MYHKIEITTGDKMFKKFQFIINKFTLLYLISLISLNLLSAQNVSTKSTEYKLISSNNAVNVNPDTHLKIIYHHEPQLGDSGKIRIYEAATDKLVDSLDLSIPPGPTTPNKSHAPYTPTPYEYKSEHITNANTKPGTPSGAALPTPDDYQITIIGGFSDGFHFYPVIIHDTVATIYPHNNLLEYDKSYYVLMDPGVLTVGNSNFSGIKNKSDWVFKTKMEPPLADAKELVVSDDGTGDFNTVQGAVDFIPDFQNNPITIFIKNGMYEEIVYFRNKTNITFVGEDREKVLVCYANNEVFNPHPSNITTNEWPGTFPSRRAVFMADNSSGIHLINFTIKSINEKPAQAEGLLLMGKDNIVSNMIIYGSGDALQINGSVYLSDTKITGFGDNVLGRGPAFFKKCELITQYGPHMWIRNTETNHGNVFLNCIFRSIGDVETVIARAPTNHGISYPYCEAVLINCALEGIRPEGWGSVGDDTSNVHYWEYNSTNLIDGEPADVSKRSPVSKQLSMEKDTEIIADYSNPAFVLGGWSPSMVPLILSQPASVKIKKGESAVFRAEATAVPEPGFQWFKDDKPLQGETNSVLTIQSAQTQNAGEYKVIVKNNSGSKSSLNAQLKFE
jgi:pectinesterase